MKIVSTPELFLFLLFSFFFYFCDESLGDGKSRVDSVIAHYLWGARFRMVPPLISLGEQARQTNLAAWWPHRGICATSKLIIQHIKMASLTLGNKINNTRRHCYDVMSWRCRAVFSSVHPRCKTNSSTRNTIWKLHLVDYWLRSLFSKTACQNKIVRVLGR